MAMVWGQGELFPTANKQEIQRTKFLLGKYTNMISLMRDFEQFEEDLRQVAIDGEVARRIDQDDLHADKTANATILIEKQRWVYQQYKFYTDQLRRAWALIQDVDEKRANEYRYIQGYSPKETLLFFRRSMSDSTIRRKIDDGIESMANSLKLMGFFEQDDAEY
ncbi:hypothetical protein [Paenibacillus segetis]|uniref:Phage transcriptional regulator, ArpU family n=1 Tax=Paenibacillus segetis TaxID=1325360 RepID=A0ABQ1YAB5_9BACL|nr:hypothetical protein [Paenibacillus segetis]GGH17206.1 hypothetical protein GCM10008013_12380 [Paenibacillus segetis]